MKFRMWKWLAVFIICALILGSLAWFAQSSVADSRLRIQVEQVWKSYNDSRIPPIPHEYENTPRAHWFFYWSSSTLASNLKQVLNGVEEDGDEFAELRQAIDRYSSAAERAKNLIENGVTREEGREECSQILDLQKSADKLLQDFVGHPLPGLTSDDSPR